MAPELTAEQAILGALARCRPGASICPTDAARLMGVEDWRAALPAIHVAAGALAARGDVQLLQRGVPVTDPHGAYRITTRRSSPDAQA